MISRGLHPKIHVLSQAIDFSPLTNIFHVISRVFRPFLSGNGLISRGLQFYQDLIEFKRMHSKDEIGANAAARAGFWDSQDHAASAKNSTASRRDADWHPRDAGATP